MVAEVVVQSLGEGEGEEPLRQGEGEAAEKRIDLGLLQHVSSDRVLESDLHSIVDTRRHSCQVLAIWRRLALWRAEILSISSPGSVGISAVVILSILSGIVGRIWSGVGCRSRAVGCAAI